MADADPPPRRFGLKPKEFARENLPGSPPTPGVHEILEANLARQQEIEAERPMDLQDHRTKRARDYWLVMITGNLLGILLWFFLPSYPLLSTLLPAGLILFNLVLYWVMFHIMNKY